MRLDNWIDQEPFPELPEEWSRVDWVIFVFTLASVLLILANLIRWMV